MKRFIINCFKFSGLFLFICLGSLLFNTLIINNYLGYKIEPNKNILILGDSHTEYAIDDSILKNSINLSHSADSYFYSNLKLRKMKKENPQIDTLFLAFSNHNLLTDYDDRWLFNTAHIKSKLRIYTDLMSFSDFLFLFKANPSAVMQGIIELPKYSLKLLIKGNLRDRGLGGFKATNRNRLKEDINQRKKNKTQRKLEYSKYELNHFFSIVNFCANNNIELILISTPIHQEYNKMKGKEIQLLNNFYNAKLSHIKFLNFTEFDIPDDSFQDLDHLNAKGARLFTEFLMPRYK